MGEKKQAIKAIRSLAKHLGFDPAVHAGDLVNLIEEHTAHQDKTIEQLEAKVARMENALRDIAYLNMGTGEGGITTVRLAHTAEQMAQIANGALPGPRISSAEVTFVDYSQGNGPFHAARLPRP